MIKLRMLYFIAWAAHMGEVWAGVQRQIYARGVVAKSTLAYKEGEGSVLPFFAYVLNGRPL
jgi:hypothetical protein